MPGCRVHAEGLVISERDHKVCKGKGGDWPPETGAAEEMKKERESKRKRERERRNKQKEIEKEREKRMEDGQWPL